jgi:hypothetical protein
LSLTFSLVMKIILKIVYMSARAFLYQSKIQIIANQQPNLTNILHKIRNKDNLRDSRNMSHCQSSSFYKNLVRVMDRTTMSIWSLALCVIYLVLGGRFLS